MRRAKKKHLETQELLREVVVPPGQLSWTCNEIDLEIIVFDDGDTSSPQITPPDDRQRLRRDLGDQVDRNWI